MKTVLYMILLKKYGVTSTFLNIKLIYIVEFQGLNVMIAEFIKLKFLGLVNRAALPS